VVGGDATTPTISTTSAVGGTSGSAEPALVADLVDLATLIGRTVWVGGLVVDLRSDGFTLDDGTAIGHVVLAGQAADAVDLIEPGDEINVTGRVEVRPDGRPAVVVADPAAISLGSALDDGAATNASADVSEVPTAAADVRTAGFGDPAAGLFGAGAGALGLVAVGLFSVAAALLRRRQARRLLAVRVGARLAAITRLRTTERPSVADVTGRRPSAEHGGEGL
jgi:hypothetical protein